MPIYNSVYMHLSAKKITFPLNITLYEIIKFCIENRMSTNQLLIQSISYVTFWSQSQLSGAKLLFGPPKLAPLSGSPSNLSSRLSKGKCMKFIGILKGNGKLVSLSKRPSYSGSQLSRVYCSSEILLSEAYKEK